MFSFHLDDDADEPFNVGLHFVPLFADMDSDVMILQILRKLHNLKPWLICKPLGFYSAEHKPKLIQTFPDLLATSSGKKS